MIETLQALGAGFASALTLPHLLWALAGVTLGTAVGVLPGIGPALTVAVLLPVTFSLDPISAFIMFGGIYYGAMYGGSTTSILLNTPGETGSIATAIDGYVMAREGRGAAALTTAAVGSFVAGTLATIALTFFAPPLAEAALLFGPAEYFSLTIVAFTTVAVLLGASVVRGLFSLFLGLALGLVGIDQLTGEARFSFGIPQLLDGIDVIVLVIGLFAVGETMYQAWRHGRDKIEAVKLQRFIGMSREEWKQSWKPWLRGTAIGFPLGVLPCGGTVIPTFLSYMVEKRLSATPERFGKGAIEGVAGPEAANNAAAAGVLVPLLTLGLPSSATAAVLLAAFQQYGLQPGPLLFASRPDLVWTLIASLYIGNVMLLVLNLPLVGVWARVMLVPRPLLFGGILGTGFPWRIQSESLDARPGDLVRRWCRRLCDAGVRLPARAGRVRTGARTSLGTAVPTRRGDQRGRPLGVLHAADLGRPAGGCRDCHARTPAMETLDDHDVIVIGGGNAGLCAALSACQAGASVLVLERAPRHLRGGNSRHTRNFRCAHAAPTDLLTESYPEDEFLADLNRVTENQGDPDLSRLLIARSAGCPEWMRQFGVRFQSSLRGTLHLSRTNLFFLGGGKALMNSYYAAATRAGVHVAYDADVTALDFVDDRCRSVTVRLGGQTVQVRARAIVLAAGGFEANIEWLREAWGNAADNFVIRGTPYNTGTILRLMLDAGAEPVGDPRACHAVAVDARAPRFDGGIVTRLDSLPFGVVVNKHAERFYDEGEDAWPKRYAIWGRLIAAQPDQIAYSIVDAKAVGTFMPSMFPVIAAGSISELASSLGLPAERLEATIAGFNQAVRPGSFNHTMLDNCRTEGLTPPKSHWAQRIDTPPFWAYPLRPGITFTYLGLRVDGSGRVVMKGGVPAENVYAAGEIMAGNVLRKGYVAGIGMTIGTVFGRVAGEAAGRHAAR